MRTAELVSYHEELNDATRAPEGAATPANDRASEVVKQPEDLAAQVTPGSAAWRNLTSWMGRNIGSAALALASIALFIGAWY